tara:strand:+ start:567 stop:734 length:168 start_codon:yes stop_codon:yes gene_type:complete
MIAATASAGLFFEPLVRAKACVILLQLKTAFPTGFKFSTDILSKDVAIVFAITSL